MTKEEKRVVDALGAAWNAFLKLPFTQTDDKDQFRHGVHSLQDMIMARPARRRLVKAKPKPKAKKQ